MSIVSEVIVMPPFRERLGTGCTKDSKDSGIDVQPKNRKERVRRYKKKAHKIDIPKEKPKKYQNDDDARQTVEHAIVIALWLIVLHITNTIFGLPFEILRPVRVDHRIVAISYAMIVFWCLCAFRFYLKKRNQNHKWIDSNPKKFAFAWFVLCLGFFLFYVATYSQLQNWSLVIVAFYFVFFATVTSTFL